MIENDLTEIKSVTDKIDAMYTVKYDDEFAYHLWSPVPILPGDVVNIHGDRYKVESRELIVDCDEDVSEIFLHCKLLV